MKSLTNIHLIDTDPMPTNYRPLTELPLIILVGLTGVGKTTSLQALNEFGQEFSLLPNRRAVTDQTIIAYLQQQAGTPIAQVTDRLERFNYTARYREQFAGGMAHALGRVALDTSAWQADRPLIFDGLRGLNEIQHAVAYFSQGRFIVLDAPDMVRLSRLLTRGDHFDQVAVPSNMGMAMDNQPLSQLQQAVPGINEVFNEAELTQLANLLHSHDLTLDEIIKKASIIVKERRNYDSQAALNYLQTQNQSELALVVDTAANLPDQVAAQIAAWL
ncbi:AAA family ATPase [Anaerolineales bacterium HSG6]|nr:AAA family ATPase [Anaerolineales bacterium HSG6]